MHHRVSRMTDRLMSAAWRTDWQTYDTAIINNNSLHLIHSMPPKNDALNTVCRQYTVLTKFELSTSSGVSVMRDNRLIYNCCHLCFCKPTHTTYPVFSYCWRLEKDKSDTTVKKWQFAVKVQRNRNYNEFCLASAKVSTTKNAFLLNFSFFE